jgi:hypothetical protein
MIGMDSGANGGFDDLANRIDHDIRLVDLYSVPTSFSNQQTTVG